MAPKAQPGRVRSMTPGALVAMTSAIISTTSSVAASDAVVVETKEQVIPAQLVDDIGASERIDAADRLRTLTQEIASAACHLSEGIDKVQSSDRLIAAFAEFASLMHALEFGDASMNIIGGETRRKTLAALQRIHAEWHPFRSAGNAVLEAPGNRDALAEIQRGNLVLLDLVTYLVSELSGEYSNPAELLQADVLLIDIAGRQSMLTQKMAKEACMIWAGHDPEASRTALIGSMQMFDISIKALLNGLPDAGIKPAPTLEIRAHLEIAMADWPDIAALLEDLVETGDLSADRRVAVYRKLNTKTALMDRIVHLYNDYSKHKYETN